MKLDMKSTNGVIVAMLVVVGLAVAFWMLALSPKRDEVAKLDSEASRLEADVALHRSEVSEGLEARREFPRDYERLAVLGKAVPGEDELASLIVQIDRIAEETGVKFRKLQLSSTESAQEAAPVSVAGAPPTEAAASLLPLGATVGPSGLAVMPYTMIFNGNFSKLADFLSGVDALVKTTNEEVAVDGRLITLDGFSLKPDPELGFPFLEGTFGVTTYVTPPEQEEAAAAPEEEPETATGTPAAATTGEAP